MEVPKFANILKNFITNKAENNFSTLSTILKIILGERLNYCASLSLENYILKLLLYEEIINNNTVKNRKGKKYGHKLINKN